MTLEQAAAARAASIEKLVSLRKEMKANLEHRIKLNGEIKEALDDVGEATDKLNELAGGRNPGFDPIKTDE